MQFAKVTKLGHRLDAKHNADEKPFVSSFGHSVSSGDTYTGFFESLPQVGQSFCLSHGIVLRTSTVKSVYVHESEDYDKLVLPKNFPKTAAHLLFPLMEKGEILFATLNSVYYVQLIEAPKTNLARKGVSISDFWAVGIRQLLNKLDLVKEFFHSLYTKALGLFVKSTPPLLDDCKECDDCSCYEAQSTPKKAVEIRAKTEDEYVKIKLPADMKKFLSPKNGDLYSNFFNWVAKKMGGIPEGKRMNVSGAWVCKKDEKKLRAVAKIYTKAALKKKGYYKPTDGLVEKTLAWYYLDLSPASFRENKPSFVKNGYVYITKDFFQDKRD
jgi:hypothetical protein